MPEFRPIGDRPLLGKVITKTEDLRVVYHDVLSESGVEKLFYAHLCGVIREDRQVRGIVVDCLEGPMVIEGKVFIDATGVITSYSIHYTKLYEQEPVEHSTAQ